MQAGTLQDVWFWLLPLCVAGYLMGSISSAILVCRLFGYPDPRTEGSNNPGATNVLRIGGKPAAALTLLGDVLKGVIPVVLARALDMGPFVAALVGTFRLSGPPVSGFLPFPGRQGRRHRVRAVIRSALAQRPGGRRTWLLVFALNRISSIASLSAFVVAPACLFAWLPQAFWPMLALSLVMIARHRSNLQKILRGEEHGFRKKD